MLGIDFEIYLVQKQKQENKGPNYFFDKEHATLCKRLSTNTCYQ